MMFLALIGTTVGILALFLAIDLRLADMSVDRIRQNLLEGGMLSALQSLSEVLAAVLGLTLTVVAIVVQLAAQRYSPKVVDLFMRDFTNLAFFAFMVVSCTYVTLIPAVANGPGMTPMVTISVGLLLCVANFGLLLPYFAHVFAFLQPSSIIDHIQEGAVRAMDTLQHRPRSKMKPVHIRTTQDQLALAIERISDSCLAAIEQADRHLAVHTLEMLESMLCSYLERESDLPPGWERVERDYFFMLSQEPFEEIIASKVWVEAKTLYEFEHAFRRSLQLQNHDIIVRIATATRTIGLKSIEMEDFAATEMVIRFFNTFLRHSINAHEVRPCYNIFYQYRTFALGLLDVRPEFFERVSAHLAYYGRLAGEMKLSFVTVIAAHDMGELCLQAHKHSPVLARSVLDNMLGILDIDDNARSNGVVTGTGVLQAFSILGARLIALGDMNLVGLVRAVLLLETKGRRARVRDRVLAVKDRKFWEITDRGVDFNYLSEEERVHFEAFFEPLLLDE